MAFPQLRRIATIWLFSCLLAPALSAGLETRALMAKNASSMRQIAMWFNIHTHSTHPSILIEPDQYQTMEDILELMVQERFNDAPLFFNYTEFHTFETDPPRTISLSSSDTQPPQIDPEFLKFPIAYSIAIYPDLDRPSSQTPLLWTRGLHNFKDFDAPYGGLVAFLDGHVAYYEGRPGKHNPALSEIFSSNGSYSEALRILEHVPATWTETTPLPVLLHFSFRGPLLIIFGTATFFGVRFGLTTPSEKKTYQKVLRGTVAFAITFFLTAIIVLTACW